MNTHQLLDWEEELDLKILALASHLEDFQLAFNLNKIIGSKLVNKKVPLSILRKGSSAQYSFYYSAPTRNTPWFYLVDNMPVESSFVSSLNSLFEENEFYRPHLIKSLKKWDYFLIGEDDFWATNNNLLKNSKNIILSREIKYDSISKSDKTILKSITYDQ